MNRRFPESTVVETYRLSEWANFMLVAGQLPLTSIVDEDETLETHDYTSNYPQVTLTTEQSRDILQHYLMESDCSVITGLDLSNKANKVLRYTYVDTHNRQITITSDKDNSYSRSSYVCMVDGSNYRVGRIYGIFHHQFQSTQTTFVNVYWFDGPYLDKDSQLHYVITESDSFTIVPFKYVSPPLVVAQDDENPKRLWILIL